MGTLSCSESALPVSRTGVDIAGKEGALCHMGAAIGLGVGPKASVRQ